MIKSIKMGEDKYCKDFFEKENKDDAVSIELFKHQVLLKFKK